MGGGITRFEQQQGLVCQSLAATKRQGLKRFLSEPALPTIRENCEEQTPALLEGNQQVTNFTKVVFPHMHPLLIYFKLQSLKQTYQSQSLSKKPPRGY